MSENEQYRIIAHPDFKSITLGARIRYMMDLRQEYLANQRDTFKWIMFPDEMTRRQNGDKIVRGPFQGYWDLKWKEKEGEYIIVCRVRSYNGNKSKDEIYTCRQRVERVAPVLSAMMRRAHELGQPQNPDVAIRATEKHIQNLEMIAEKFGVPANKKDEHKKTVQLYRNYLGHLKTLMKSESDLVYKPSIKYTPIPIFAVYLEAETQKKNQLNVFVARKRFISTYRGGEIYQGEEWVLVDWTNPGNKLVSRECKGEGKNAKEAIQNAIAEWDSFNRYPEGNIQWEIPETAGGPTKPGSFITDGKSRYDWLTGALEQVALGGMIVFGIVSLLAPFPGSRIASAAVWTSIFSSTAAAAINIYQRNRRGYSNFREDAIDGLTVLGNCMMGLGVAARVGATAWRQGAWLKIADKSGTIQRWSIIGEIGSDGMQGVLIIESGLKKYETILQDPNYTPQERSEKILELFRSLGLSGMMTYLNIKGGKGELKTLGKGSNYVKDAFTQSGKAKLEDLKVKNKEIDLTKRPKTEGHTKLGKQKTQIRRKPKRLNTKEWKNLEDIFPVPTFKVRKETPDEFFIVEIGTQFQFQAKCKNGTLDITIITKELDHSGRPIPNGPKSSKPLKAPVLYPFMFDYFARKKNPVKRMKGLLAWENYEIFAKIKKGPPQLSSENALRKMIEQEGGTTKYWVNEQGVKFDDVKIAVDKPEAGHVGLLSFEVHLTSTGKN